MAHGVLVGTVPNSVNTQLGQLALLLVRILRACNVDPDLLAASVSALTQAERTDSPTHAIWESPDLHLACTCIVFAWRRDSKYLDLEGNPRDLERMNADQAKAPTFDSLCSCEAPQHTLEKLLDYLLAMGAVQVLQDGKIRLLAESVLACSGRPESTVATETVLMHLQGFLGAVEFNLSRRNAEIPARFERACYGEIPTKLVPVFQQLVASRGQNFIDSIDEWLDRHSPKQDEGTPLSRVGAGAYMLTNNSI